MTSLIDQIQAAAVSSETKIGDLLRMTLAAARKLGVADTASWVERELNGYEGVPSEDMPTYRRVRGTVSAFNRYAGYTDVFFPDKEWEEALTRRPDRNPIGTVLSIIDNHKGGSVMFSFPADILRQLQKVYDTDDNFVFRVATPAFEGIVDCVKTAILEWALELESRGVKGEGMSFTDDERKRARTVNINVSAQNFSGVVGDTGGNVAVTSSQTAGLSGAELAHIMSLVADLRSVTKGLPAEAVQAVLVEADKLEAEATGEKRPGIIKETLGAIRNAIPEAIQQTVRDQLVRQLDLLAALIDRVI